MKNIRLEYYKEIHREQLEKFEIPEEQLHYTALPTWILNEAITNPYKHPVVLINDHHVLGFFILDSGEDRSIYSTNVNAILLRAYSINYKEQGKGYGKLAMQLLPQFVENNFKGIDEVVLGSIRKTLLL